MILRRPIECLFLIWMTFICCGCCSSMNDTKGFSSASSSSSLLNNWRRKAQQSARLFDRLPQNPEVNYTPVISILNDLTPTIVASFDLNFGRLKSSRIVAIQLRSITSKRTMDTF